MTSIPLDGDRHDTPLVSVIIPTYNQPDMLLEAISSALNQSYKDLEIIVVDDGSTDDTAARLRKLVDAEAITYVFQQNKRQAAARNAGIAASSGDLIAFLDHDDLWEPHKLERQVPLFRNERVALTFTGAREVDLAGKILFNYPQEHYKRGHIFDTLLDKHFITNSSVMIRRSVFDAVGPFREDLFGVDDTHLWLKICHDYEVDFIPDILTTCRSHDSNMKKDPLILPEKRFLLLLDIFKRFGLDRLRSREWLQLNAEYNLSLGLRQRPISKATALRCYLRSMQYDFRWTQVGAILKLAVPRIAERLIRHRHPEESQ